MAKFGNIDMQGYNPYDFAKWWQLTPAQYDRLTHAVALAHQHDLRCKEVTVLHTVNTEGLLEHVH
jgi:hypothetical protein